MVQKILTKVASLVARQTGHKLVKSNAQIIMNRFDDLATGDQEIIRKVAEYTMTGPERLIALINAIEYLERKNIPGDIVECGVWRGGSMMATALKLINLGATDRELFLYDTFEGMVEPTELDMHHGTLASSLKPSSGSWCEADLDDVTQNMHSTKYPLERLHFIQGRVEETLRSQVPNQIALLRLDTDWYESTKLELEVLYPQLAQNGVLIIDDYGHWSGAKKAVDEFFQGKTIYMHRIDYTGRLIVKTQN